MRYPTFAPATSSIRSRKRRLARRRDSREEISTELKGRAGMQQAGVASVPASIFVQQQLN